MKITPYNLHKAPLLPRKSSVSKQPNSCPGSEGAFRFIQSSAAEGSAVASFRAPRILGIYNFPVGGDPTEAHQDQIAISQSRFSEQHGKCVSSTCLGRSAPERGRSTSRKSDRTGGVRADCDGIGSLTLRSAIASQEQGPILLTQLEARLWDLHALPGAREPRQPTTQPGTAPPALR